MHLSRRVIRQLILFSIIALIAVTTMVFEYMRLPAQWFNIGHYNVTIELPQAAGLYASGNVTYRGTEVGRVTSVSLTDTGAQATISLTSDVKIPADLEAEVHSQSAVGEQFIALLPRSGDGPVLREGDVIPVDRTTVPPDINSLLDATNTGLQAIPRDNLKTVIDESYRAVGGLGPEVSRFVRGSTRLAIDSRAHLDDLTRLIDGAAPVLDSQADTADAVTGWASHLATVTSQLRDHDGDLRGILQNGPQAASEAQALFDRLQPTLPIVLANLVSLGDVAVTYNASIEQILVLLPQGAQEMQAINTANRNSKQAYKGGFLDFNLNLNLPPPCTTGFLPIQQQRAPTFEDYPDRPAGDVYCRVPQDSMFNVRGARNTPCITRPGKRAPTVAMCESDEQYEPLNEGYNWKGDPNATMSGQPIPQLPPGAAPVAAPTQAAPPPIAVAEYDPGTGNYIGPDGKVYTQTDLAQQQQEKTWQTMLLPPTNP